MQCPVGGRRCRTRQDGGRSPELSEDLRCRREERVFGGLELDALLDDAPSDHTLLFVRATWDYGGKQGASEER